MSGQERKAAAPQAEPMVAAAAVERVMDHRAHWRTAIVMMRDFGHLLAGKDGDADHTDWELVRKDFESALDALAAAPQAEQQATEISARIDALMPLPDFVPQQGISTGEAPAMYYSRGVVREAIRAALAAQKAEQQPVPSCVWVVENRTSFGLFATKADADAFLSKQPPSVAGGMHVGAIPVIGAAPAAPQSSQGAAPAQPEVTPAGMVLVPRELLKDAAESVDDYRGGVEFGSCDRELLGRLKAAARLPDAAAQSPAVVDGEPSACKHKWRATQSGQTFLRLRCELCGATEEKTWD